MKHTHEVVPGLMYIADTAAAAPAAAPAAMLERLMQLPEEQIAMLPPDKAKHLRDIRDNLRAQQSGGGGGGATANPRAASAAPPCPDAAMLERLMQLPEEQIAMLPPDKAKHLRDIRDDLRAQQSGGGNGGVATTNTRAASAARAAPAAGPDAAMVERLMRLPEELIAMLPPDKAEQLRGIRHRLEQERFGNTDGELGGRTDSYSEAVLVASAPAPSRLHSTAAGITSSESGGSSGRYIAAVAPAAPASFSPTASPDAEMLDRLMQLPEEQIALLPPDKAKRLRSIRRDTAAAMTEEEIDLLPPDKAKRLRDIRRDTAAAAAAEEAGRRESVTLRVFVEALVRRSPPITADAVHKPGLGHLLLGMVVTALTTYAPKSRGENRNAPWSLQRAPP